MHIKGKALLVITRLHADGETPHYEVHAFVQSDSGFGSDPRDVVQEEFQNTEWDVHPLPDRAYKLEQGDTLREAVTYYISWFKDYFGEVDSTLEYLKQKRMRLQKYRERYITKKDRRP